MRRFITAAADQTTDGSCACMPPNCAIVMWNRSLNAISSGRKACQLAARRFTLADMRPSAVTERMEDGDEKIVDATGHADGRMVAKIYDRRRERKVKLPADDLPKLEVHLPKIVI